MDLVRYGLEESLEKRGGGMPVRPVVQLGIGKLRGAIDGDEEVELHPLKSAAPAFFTVD